jgi:hypothetical protein
MVPDTPAPWAYAVARSAFEALSFEEPASPAAFFLKVLTPRRARLRQQREIVMRPKLLNDREGERTFAVILSTGDEVTHCLKNFVTENKIDGAEVHAIGAFSDVELGYFEWETKKYRKDRFQERVEIASLTGDVATGPATACKHPIT